MDFKKGPNGVSGRVLGSGRRRRAGRPNWGDLVVERILFDPEVDVEFLEPLHKSLMELFGCEGLGDGDGRGVHGEREVVELFGNSCEDVDGGVEVRLVDFFVVVGDLASGVLGDGEPDDSAELGGHGLGEDAFELHHSLVFVGEAEAVGELVLHHAAILDDAVEPFGGASVSSVVVDSGDGFVEGEGELGELLEKLLGDLAMGFEEGQLFADEVLVFEFEEVFVVGAHFLDLYVVVVVANLYGRYIP